MILKRQMKKVSLYVILFMLALACIMIKYAADNFTVTIEIGVVNRDTGHVSEMIEKNLYSHKGLIKFKEFLSYEELEKGVQSGKIQGGYVLKEDFSRKLLKGENNDIIQALSTPNSIISSIANEIFFTFVMKEISYEELVKDTEETGLFKKLTDSEIRASLRKYYDVNLSDGSTFSVDYDENVEGFEGKSVNIDTYDYISPIITGIVGLMIFVGGMCGAVNYYDDREKNSLLLLKPLERQAVSIMEISVPVVIITITGVIILTLLEMERNPLEAAGRYILYGIIVVAYCYVLKTIVRKKDIYVSLIPLFILLSVILCPVFVNLASITPKIGVIGKVLPLYWLYML